MRIATKLNAGILGVLAASVLANYFVLQTAIKPKFDEIEIASAQQNHKRVLDALDGLYEKLRASVQDYAFWDDAYDYATGKDKRRFLVSNFNPVAEAFDSLAVSFVSIRDANGRVLWKEAFDQKNETHMPEFAKELTGLGYSQHPLLSGKGELKTITGLVQTSKGLMVMASAPIVKGDRKGKPAGTFVMAQFLDQKSLQDMTGVKFDFDFSTGAGEHASDAVRIMTLNGTVETTTVVDDMTGVPLLRLHAQTPRTVSSAGADAIRTATWLMLAAAAIVILVLGSLVHTIVVSRIAALKAHFASASASGYLSRTENDPVNDELGQVSAAFNEMTDQVNFLRDSLADSAYQSGLSEWASSTLHNVRNGLTPVNIGAWKLKKLHEAPWLANVKSALGELENADTPVDRRERLTAFVVAKAAALLESADKTLLVSDEISASSKSITELVGEYEKFTRQDNTHEPVDLLPLLQEAAKTAVEGEASKISLNLPTASALAAGNRAVLRKVLAELALCACDALKDQSHEKTLSIELITGGAAGTVTVLISNNGPCIAPENLKNMFERGSQKAGVKNGGLGLHWCANAVNALGGSLHAENTGRRLGSTLVLCLPKFIPSVKEAA